MKEKINKGIKNSVCQYCLADLRYTKISKDKNRWCPVCGSDYTGPRRHEEFAAIRDAGLLANDD